MMMEKAKDPLTEKIIACCFKVHNELGPGFAEKIYHKALMITFENAGLTYESEKTFDVFFQEKKGGAFRLDLLVEGKVIVELKALTGNVPEVFKYQVLSYLKASGVHVGLLINFGNKSCHIKRFIV